MPSLKAHFDGNSIVLDEPATLAIGQAVRVIVDAEPPADLHRQSRAGVANDELVASFTPFVDMTAVLINGDVWDESAALAIEPLDAVPPDFVRRPGSAAGQIKTAADFDAIPEGFEEYL